MSLMAGFDVVTEISNSAFLGLIKATVQIGGVSMRPPFEMTLPFGSGPVSGSAHLVGTNILLDLNADNTVTLTLDFDRGSVILSSPPELVICPLNGVILIQTTPIQISTLTVKAVVSAFVSLSFAGATTTLEFSAPADQAIQQALAGTPFTSATFYLMAKEALSSLVSSMTAITIPVGTVTPGFDGSLSSNGSPPVYEHVPMVSCIPNANRDLQALALFGILIAANNANGNPALKTTTAITTAADGIAVSLSPQAFHTLNFCPGLANAFGVAVSNLPTTCGGSSGLPMQGLTLTGLVDIFDFDKIDLIGTAQKSGFCYNATASIQAALSFSVVAGKLTPNIAIVHVDTSVTIDWYCYLTPAVVAGPISLGVGESFVLLGNAVASGLATAPLNAAVAKAQAGSKPQGLPIGVLTGVSVSPEGLTLQGSLPSSGSGAAASMALLLTGSVTTTSSSAISSGTLHLQVWCLPAAKDYPFAESAQQQNGTFILSGTLVSQPLFPRFYLVANGSKAPLPGTSGTVVVPAVQTFYPTPVGTAGQTVNQDVHVSYQTAGTLIHLTNLPAEGNYTVSLYAEAADCSGNPIADNNGTPINASIDVEFEGDHVDIGGSYSDDEQGCAALLYKWLRQNFKNDPLLWKNVPEWVPVDHPEPETLIAYLRGLITLGVPQADMIVHATAIAHGNSFYRALLSRAAKQPGLIPSAPTVDRF
jgi:hypothetical protein